MTDIGFPDIQAHKKMHAYFSRQVDTLLHDFETGNHVLNSEVIKRIENWLTGHILKEDMKIQAYLQSNGS